MMLLGNQLLVSALIAMRPNVQRSNKDSGCSSNLLYTLFIMVVVSTTAPHGENNQHEKRETHTDLTCLLDKFQQSTYSISIDGDMVLDKKTKMLWRRMFSCGPRRMTCG
jgi:hypothetical protein